MVITSICATCMLPFLHKNIMIIIYIESAYMSKGRAEARDKLKGKGGEQEYQLASL